MPVPQHVLNWLYSVLTNEYHDVNRTYNDVAQALAQCPTLSPRTDVHTFDNGVSALLLHLSGTIPVLFRGTTYRFPVSIWVPHAYPREAPLVYVTPTETMVVRPGQHVDPQGQVYHPYLAGWSSFWDKSTILDFLAILKDIFAKEPPVISRQQQKQAQQPPTRPAEQGPPPVPPLPPDLTRSLSPRSGTPQGHADAARPPPPPPKGGYSPSPSVMSSGAASYGHGPPPLPPAPHRPSSHYGPSPTSPLGAQGNRISRYDSAPPLPPQPGATPRPPSQAQPPPQHLGQPPQSLAQNQYRYSQPPPPPGPDPHRFSPPPPPPQAYGPGPSPGPLPGWQPTAGPPHQAYQHPHQAAPIPQPPQPRAPPPPDLMDDPLTLPLPGAGADDLPPAPPIPPNPEKDALLRQLAQTLYDLRQRARAQNDASLAGLAAQRTAMLSALGAVQADAAALSQLQALLASNAAILQEAQRRADTVIEKSKTQKPPDIDELLVAPTVVGNQLYALVAEERAIGDAIFVLGKAVERGRVTPHVFARTTRGLAREWYLKKALVRKIGRGMGLVA